MRLTLKPWRRLTDEELMTSVAAGSGPAFSELYRRYARRLEGFFVVRTADAEQAADLVQELFLRLWSARRRYEPGRAVTPWLFTLAYNLVRNAWRHDGVVSAYAGEAGEDDGVEEESVTLRLDAATFDCALAEVLTTLQPDERVLFSLRFEEELALSDIAAVMSLPVGTVKSRLHRLTRKLQQKLKAYE